MNFRRNFYKNFLFYHLNINGLRNKFCEIFDVLNNGFVDVMGLSETKIDSSFMTSQFNVCNFKIYRKDRNSRGGGIMFYVRSDLPQRIRPDLECNINSEVEHLVLEVILRKEKFIFILMYSPPNVAKEKTIQTMSNVLDKCCCECKTLYVMGDLNVNCLLDNHALSETFEMYNLKNIIQGPTCFKNVSNPSLLDVILTNSLPRISSHVNVTTGVSDFHNLVGAAMKLHVPKPEPRIITYRSYKRFDEKKFQNDLWHAPFHVSKIFDDVDDQMWFHGALLSNLVNDHAPLKTKKITKTQLPYMNGELRKAINVKAMLKRKYDKFQTNAAWSNYKRQRNLVNSLKRKSLKKYFDTKCNKETLSSKTFWNTMKPFLSDKVCDESNITLFKEGLLMNDQGSVCTAFNDYFINVACNAEEARVTSVEESLKMHERHSSIRNIRQARAPDSTFSFCPVQPSQTLQKLKHLKLNASSGYDFIPAKLLKLGSEALSISLTPILNACISMSTYPPDFKRAEVRPIHKKNDPMNVENYRPVDSMRPSRVAAEGRRIRRCA